MSQPYFDLRPLRANFIEIGEILQNKRLQLDLIEAELAPVKEGLEKFAHKHLEIIKDPDEKYWIFLKWWRIPIIEPSQYEIIGEAINSLKPNDKESIIKLNEIFKNIEIVSCILRFVDPDNYGILSPPVETLLSVHEEKPEQKYLNYLNNLQELQKEYLFSRICDVDMALWTLANILNYAEVRQNPKYKAIYENYRRTINPIKLIMARNSLQQIWEEKQYMNIAELFLETDFKLAGILASRELERMVKEACIKFGIPLNKPQILPHRKPEYREFMDLVTDLSKENEFIRGYMADIGNWRRLRANLLHEIEIDTSIEEVHDMIAGIKQISAYF